MFRVDYSGGKVTASDIALQDRTGKLKAIRSKGILLVSGAADTILLNYHSKKRRSQDTSQYTLFSDIK